MYEVVETEPTGSLLGVVIILGVIGLATIGAYQVGTVTGKTLRKLRKK
jgi:hypothetical protein